MDIENLIENKVKAEAEETARETAEIVVETLAAAAVEKAAEIQTETVAEDIIESVAEKIAENAAILSELDSINQRMDMIFVRLNEIGALTQEMLTIEKMEVSEPPINEIVEKNEIPPEEPAPVDEKPSRKKVRKWL